MLLLDSVLEQTLPDPKTLAASHSVATWMLGHINRLLSYVGLNDNQVAIEIVYVAVIAAIAFLVGYVLKYVLLWVLGKAVKLRKSDVGQQLIKEHTFSKCLHIIPPLVFMALIPFAFNSSSHVLSMIMRVTGVYLIVAFCIGLSGILRFIFNRYNARNNTRNLPLKGILNVATGLVWIIAIILAVSVLIDKSPATLLAGMTAFAAALMLIFKDSILGFVAGIQIASNDMVRVGDWIVVPSTPANGTVMDMSLSTVKVQNFDNTIVTIPPYTLVSSGVQNWRGMSESGVRRIMRNFTIDYEGVGPVTPELLESIEAKYPVVKPYIDAMQQQGADAWMVNGGLRKPNGTIETNLGLFRAYLCAYLSANPHISDTHRILVRQMDATVYGYQLQIWCWAATTDWNAYEAIQSAVMEHVALVVGDFGLDIYNDGVETVDLQGPVTAPHP